MSDPIPLNPQTRLYVLGVLLGQHHPVWHPRPFEHLPAPWEAQLPEASAWLDAQDPERLEQPGWAEGADVPAPFACWAREVAVAATHPVAVDPVAPLPPRFGRGLPGRKRAQVEGFAAPIRPWLRPDAGPLTLLDWCGGKAWLGQSLLLDRVPVPQTTLRVLEWDAALGADAEKRCEIMGLPCEAHIADALDPAAAQHLAGVDVAVGLHACGDLHAALLRGVAAHDVPRLALAPCCYNKVAVPEAVVLSTLGRACGPTLTRTDLDLIHREVVVAHADDVRRARQSQAWRLGFDAWRVASGGSPAYRSLPSFSKAVLALSFTEFCGQFRERVLAEDGPAAWPDPTPDPTPFEAQGWARLDRVRRREAVRGLFRPALEAWLVLDRAQWLAEHGYQVRVDVFCPREVSPRNALIRAWKAR